MKIWLHDHIILLLVALTLLAALLKAAYLLDYKKEVPYYHIMLSDSYTYDLWAKQIVAGDWLSSKWYYQAPLYPYLLAFAYKLGYSQPAVVYIIQIIIGLGNILLTYYLGCIVFNRTVGLIASIAVLFYAPFTFFECKLLSTTTSIFLNLGTLILIIKAYQNHRYIYWFGAGIYLGSAILISAHIVIFLPMSLIFILFSYYKKGKRGIYTFLSFSTGVGVLLLISALRYYIICNTFTFLPFNGGFAFYIGNNPEAVGLYATVPGISDDILKQPEDTKRVAEREEKRRMTLYEVSQYWRSKAFGFILKNPVQALHLFWRKLLYFCSNYEFGENYDLPSEKELTNTLAYFFLPFGIILGLGLVGVLYSSFSMGLHRILYIYLITYFLFNIIFFGSSRFRIPIVPILSIYSGYGFLKILSLWGDKRWRKLILAVFILAVCITVSAVDHSKIAVRGLAIAYNNLAQNFVKLNQSEKALLYYEKASFLSPYLFSARRGIVYTLILLEKPIEGFENAEFCLREEGPTAENLYCMANIQIEIGHLEKGLKILSNLLEKYPDYQYAKYKKKYLEDLGYKEKAAICYRCGTNLLKQNYISEAKDAFENALSYYPDHLEAKINLASVYYLEKYYYKAIALYSDVLKERQNWVMVRLNLIQVYIKIGKIEEAWKECMICLTLEPSNKNVLLIHNELLKLRK